MRIGVIMLLGCVVAAGACRGVDELEPSPAPVAELVALSESAVESAESGEQIEVGLQALDEEGQGIDDVELFFAVSDARLLRFSDAEGQESLRVTTKRRTFGDVHANGLAVADLVVGEASKDTVVTVWGGLASTLDGSDVDEASLSRVAQFKIPVDSAESGAGGSNQ